MNTTKREAPPAPINDQKRSREDVLVVKKLNFRRGSTSANELTKDSKNKQISPLNVRRSRRVKRRSSYGSSSESDVGGVRKKHDSSKDEDQPMRKREKPLTGFEVAEQKNCCSTPNRMGNDMKGCEAQFSENIHKPEQTFAQLVASPFGMKSGLNNSSFYDDDGTLAALNLSEIITSSAGVDPVQSGNCASSTKEEENQFYGLPLKVKELLQKYKGIESLYGKLLS